MVDAVAHKMLAANAYPAVVSLRLQLLKQRLEPEVVGNKESWGIITGYIKKLAVLETRLEAFLQLTEEDHHDGTGEDRSIL